MVRLPDSGKLRPALPFGKATVKLETADPSDDEDTPLAKRSKIAPPAPFGQQAVMLDEPSPLGLRLRKSPSLVDLIQMTLLQTDSSAASRSSSFGCLEERKKKELKSTVVSGGTEKLKASNFPISLLRIGAWERVSKHEGDLVAKCYFAKHKLVWEILEGGLKSKIEIQWPDIIALEATCPNNEQGSLHIVLARPPLFFRETDPQPRKHTLWQPAQDFTGGQANLHRRHFLQCSHGFLSKNFEKILQCDPRLNFLSQQPGTVLDLPPHFESQCSIFEDPDDSKCQVAETRKDDYESTFSSFSKSSSAVANLSIPNNREQQDSVERMPDVALRNTASSPYSGQSGSHLVISLQSAAPDMSIPNKDTWVRKNEEYACKEGQRSSDSWNKLRLSRNSGSTSMNDLANSFGHHTSEHAISSNPTSTETLWNMKISGDLKQYLLDDSQFYITSDETSPLFAVNTLHSLLQKDAATGKIQNPYLHDSDEWRLDDVGSENELVEEKPVMSRKESFGELLLLPRIASMPQFLFDIAEDAKN